MSSGPVVVAVTRSLPATAVANRTQPVLAPRPPQARKTPGDVSSGCSSVKCSLLNSAVAAKRAAERYGVSPRVSPGRKSNDADAAEGARQEATVNTVARSEPRIEGVISAPMIGEGEQPGGGGSPFLYPGWLPVAGGIGEGARMASARPTRRIRSM